MEVEVKGVSEFGEAVPGSNQGLQVGAEGGDFQGWRRVALGYGLHEGGPLEAVHDVKVDDVDGLVAVDCFQDCLVGGEVAESYEWGYLVQGQVGGGAEEGFVVGGSGGGIGGGEAEREGFGELVDEAFGRVAERGGGGGEEGEEAVGCGVVGAGDQVSAGNEELAFVD